MKTLGRQFAKFIEMIGITQYILLDKKFKQMAKKRPQDFTRNRKMSFTEVCLALLNQVRCSTQVHLERFFDTIGRPEIYMEQQSFSDARQKINWEAFRYLFEEIGNFIYGQDKAWNTWHGYTVAAIDGSKTQLPGDPLLLRDFGGTGAGAKAATAQASYLYDVLNDILIDARIDTLATDERTLAKQHLERLQKIPNLKKLLLVFDRGYPSADLVTEIATLGYDFLFRVRTKFNVDFDAMPLGVHNYNFKCEQRETIPVRVIRLELDSGEIETLMTSIQDKRMGVEAFKALYFKRWGVETKIGELKHKIEIENFSGRTKLTIFQDFFVSVYLSNMIAVAVRESQKVIDFAAATGKQVNKYAYKVNRNHAVGVFKDRFIAALLEDDPHKRDKKVARVLALLAKEKTPIRPGRSVPRNPNPRDANFYHNTKSNA